MMMGWTPGVFLVLLVLSRTFALPHPPDSTSDVVDYDGDDGEANIFVRQTRKHARPMFYINCGYRDLCYCYSKITRHHYCCSCEVGACFPGSAKVATPPSPTASFTAMENLKTGDEVLAVDESGKVVTSSVLGFMDRRPNEVALYVTLRTAIGRNLTLSPNHVLFKSAPNSSHPISAFGSDISVGDVIFSVNKTSLERTEVVAIEHNIMKGAYVPLTREGTLVVDGALASCYASYRHSLAHSFLAPVRAFPALLWPRPGFLSNIGLLLMNLTSGITDFGLELLKGFLGETRCIISEGNSAFKGGASDVGHFTSGMDYNTYSRSNDRSYDRERGLRSPSFGMLDLEGVGEAYYISLVKLIGWLLFRDQKAFTPVIQINPQQPQWTDMPHIFALSSNFENWHSLFLRIVPRSW